MYAVCWEFLTVKLHFSNQIFGDMHVNKKINLRNVSFLCNCGGLAIIITKNSIDATIWSEILQYFLHIPCKHGLIYTMRYDANLRVYPDT